MVHRFGDSTFLNEHAQNVQENVNQVIANHPIAPKFLLDPKDGVNQRIILLRCSNLRPDLDEAVPGTQFRLGDVSVVIPNRFDGPRRQISESGGNN